MVGFGITCILLQPLREGRCLHHLPPLTKRWKVPASPASYYKEMEGACITCLLLQPLREMDGIWHSSLTGLNSLILTRDVSKTPKKGTLSQDTPASQLKKQNGTNDHGENYLENVAKETNKQTKKLELISRIQIL